MKFFCLISTLAPASIVATMMAAAGPEDVVPATGVFYFTPVTTTTSGAALSVPTAPTNVTTTTTNTTNTTNTTTLSGVGTVVTLANANVFCPKRLPNAVDSCWFLMTIISPDSTCVCHNFCNGQFVGCDESWMGNADCPGGAGLAYVAGCTFADVPPTSIFVGATVPTPVVAAVPVPAPTTTATATTIAPVQCLQCPTNAESNSTCVTDINAECFCSAGFVRSARACVLAVAAATPVLAAAPVLETIPAIECLTCPANSYQTMGCIQSIETECVCLLGYAYSNKSCVKVQIATTAASVPPPAVAPAPAPVQANALPAVALPTFPPRGTAVTAVTNQTAAVTNDTAAITADFLFGKDEDCDESSKSEKGGKRSLLGGGEDCGRSKGGEKGKSSDKEAVESGLQSGATTSRGSAMMVRAVVAAVTVAAIGLCL